MPLALFAIGTVLIVSALRGTEKQLGVLVVGDLQGGFLKWLAAIFIIGLLGYIPRAELPSRVLLALVLIVIFLANGGLIQQFSEQVTNIQPVASPAPIQITQNPTVNVGGTGNTKSGSGGILGDIGSGLGVVKTIGGFFGL